MTSNKQVILITGASSGIGKRTAELLVSHGYTVFGTSRNPKAVEINGVRLVKLDVTDDESAHACVQEVLAEVGQIDVLVNNAGVELSGALEETSLEEVRALMEANFFGVIRMIHAVLPHMRERRTGEIINIGSAAGTVGVPYQPIYAASKHAIRGLTDSMRFEVEPFNIGVFVVQPNTFKSEIASRSPHAKNQISAYSPDRDRMIYTFDYRIEHGADSIAVAKRIQAIVDGRVRHWLQPVGFQARMAEIRLIYLPVFWDSVMRWMWSLGKQEGTPFALLMAVLYGVVGRKDNTVPPGIPPAQDK